MKSHPWARYQTQRPTYEEIMSWDERCNLALATGQLSGVVVVDCESQEDAEWFIQNRSDTPLKVRTPRGMHLYFRHPGEYVKNGQKITDEAGRPRYDIRGDGGYVLVPPSSVTANGSDIKQSGTYRWATKICRSKLLPVIQQAWGRKETTSPNREPLQPVEGIRNPKAYIRKIHAISGNRGHDSTYQVARILQESGMSPEDAFAEMVLWNQTNADPPWSVRELQHKIHSAYRGTA